MSGKNTAALVRIRRIEERILVIRGQKVIVDAGLAQLYGVPIKALNQAVLRRKRPVFSFDQQVKNFVAH